MTVRYNTFRAQEVGGKSNRSFYPFAKRIGTWPRSGAVFFQRWKLHPGIRSVRPSVCSSICHHPISVRTFFLAVSHNIRFHVVAARLSICQEFDMCNINNQHYRFLTLVVFTQLLSSTFCAACCIQTYSEARAMTELIF